MEKKKLPVLNILNKVLGLTEVVEKVLPTALKENNKKLSSKRIFKLLGGGYLVIQGVDLVIKGSEAGNELMVYSGLGLAAIGVIGAILLSSKIESIQNESDATDK